MNIKLLDSVALTRDLPEYNLSRGQSGTVVEILADGKAFEIEFSAPDGRTLSPSLCARIRSLCAAIDS